MLVIDELCLVIFVKSCDIANHVRTSEAHVVVTVAQVSPIETLEVLVSEVVGFEVFTIVIRILDMTVS